MQTSFATNLNNPTDNDEENALDQLKAIAADLQAIADMAQRFSQNNMSAEGAAVITNSKPSESQEVLQNQLGQIAQAQLEVADKVADLVMSGVDENVIADQLGDKINSIGGVFGEIVREKIRMKKEEKEREERLSILDSQKHAANAAIEAPRRNIDNLAVTQVVSDIGRLKADLQRPNFGEKNIVAAEQNKTVLRDSQTVSQQAGRDANSRINNVEPAQRSKIVEAAQKNNVDTVQRNNAKAQVAEANLPKPQIQTEPSQQVQKLARQAVDVLRAVDAQLKTIAPQIPARAEQIIEANKQSNASARGLIEITKQPPLKNLPEVTAQVNTAVQKTADSAANINNLVTKLNTLELKPELKPRVAELQNSAKSLEGINRQLQTQKETLPAAAKFEQSQAEMARKIEGLQRKEQIKTDLAQPKPDLKEPAAPKPAPDIKLVEPKPKPLLNDKGNQDKGLKPVPIMPASPPQPKPSAGPVAPAPTNKPISPLPPTATLAPKPPVPLATPEPLKPPVPTAGPPPKPKPEIVNPCAICPCGKCTDPAKLAESQRIKLNTGGFTKNNSDKGKAFTPAPSSTPQPAFAATGNQQNR